MNPTGIKLDIRNRNSLTSIFKTSLKDLSQRIRNPYSETAASSGVADLADTPFASKMA
jgi:hypothetical protein